MKENRPYFTRLIAPSEKNINLMTGDSIVRSILFYLYSILDSIQETDGYGQRRSFVNRVEMGRKKCSKGILSLWRANPS